MGPDLELWEGILRLLLALGLAGAIGLEREIHEQEAGLRTHILVGMGACLFVLIGNYAWEDLDFGSAAGVTLDPSRVIAYVVTGIGFLGAGAILKHGINVRGLTTAASLWVTAAVGATSASGEYVWAVTAAGIILVSLWPLRWIAASVGVRSGGALRVQVELERDVVIEHSGPLGALLFGTAGRPCAACDPRAARRRDRDLRGNLPTRAVAEPRDDQRRPTQDGAVTAVRGRRA